MRRLLRDLDELHDRLRSEASIPHRWSGMLRRQAEIDSVTSSTSIEGYTVDGGAAMALVGGTRTPADAPQHAVAGYGRAMDHIMVMSDDPEFTWSTRVILDLHFDACSFQRLASPGRWRDGPVYVTAPDGATAYTGPSADQVPDLMRHVTAWLEDGDLDQHVVVRAAMAHLHVVSVHPFRDGNGRVSRLVQSLVLARAGILAPSLGSIEPYLARNTAAYYEQLHLAHGSEYDPTRDARQWVEFCVHAHVEEASRRLRTYALAAHRWTALEQHVSAHGWPDRLVIALEQALMGGVDRSSYVAEAGISAPAATIDFRQLRSAGLLVPVGRGRMTSYVASDRLRALVEEGQPSHD